MKAKQSSFFSTVPGRKTIADHLHALRVVKEKIKALETENARLKDLLENPHKIRVIHEKDVSEYLQWCETRKSECSPVLARKKGKKITEYSLDEYLKQNRAIEPKRPKKSRNADTNVKRKRLYEKRLKKHEEFKNRWFEASKEAGGGTI